MRFPYRMKREKLRLVYLSVSVAMGSVYHIRFRSVGCPVGCRVSGCWLACVLSGSLSMTIVAIIPIKCARSSVFFESWRQLPYTFFYYFVYLANRESF